MAALALVTATPSADDFLPGELLTVDKDGLVEVGTMWMGNLNEDGIPDVVFLDDKYLGFMNGGIQHGWAVEEPTMMVVDDVEVVPLANPDLTDALLLAGPTGLHVARWSPTFQADLIPGAGADYDRVAVSRYVSGQPHFVAALHSNGLHVDVCKLDAAGTLLPPVSTINLTESAHEIALLRYVSSGAPSLVAMGTSGAWIFSFDGSPQAMIPRTIGSGSVIPKDDSVVVLQHGPLEERLAWCETDGGNLHHLHVVGLNGAEPVAILNGAWRPQALAAGTVDGDDREDLAITSRVAGQVTILINQSAAAGQPSFPQNGNGVYVLNAPANTPGDFGGALLGDLDNDGDTDLLQPLSTTDGACLWFGKEFDHEAWKIRVDLDTPPIVEKTAFGHRIALLRIGPVNVPSDPEGGDGPTHLVMRGYARHTDNGPFELVAGCPSYCDIDNLTWPAHTIMFAPWYDFPVLAYEDLRYVRLEPGMPPKAYPGGMWVIGEGLDVMGGGAAPMGAPAGGGSGDKGDPEHPDEPGGDEATKPVVSRTPRLGGGRTEP